jgi:ABC-type uncharacterized transport system involved in gliding motility auxiliary subunit
MKSFSKYFYSIIGIIAVFLIIFFLNLAVSNLNIRLDTTEEGLYSLSESTINILSDLKKDVTIKVFYSKEVSNLPISIKNYAQRVIDLLKEYKLYGKDKIKLEIYNPSPDSEEEDLAKKYGIEGLDISANDRLYFGIAAVSESKEESIAFMDPAREIHLEYDITRLITILENEKRKKIGIISALPVFGFSPLSFKTMHSMAPGEPWYFLSEIEKTYDVAEIGLDMKKIDNDVDMLVIIHPKGLSEELQKSIDNFILSGKNAIIFTDTYAFSEKSQDVLKASSMENFFKHWGISVNPAAAVVDFSHSTFVATQDGKVESNPLWISLNENSVDKESIITSQIEKILLPVAGAISKLPDCYLEVTPLMYSSKNSNLDSNFLENFNEKNLKKEFKASGEVYNFAVKLSGKFKSAFKDEKSEKESTVIIVSDVDMLSDDYSVRRQNFLGFNIAQVFNDNISFFMNTVEFLTGSKDLIAIRTIGKFERPFTKVAELQENAQIKWLSKEQELIKRAEETSKKIDMLEAAKKEGGDASLTKEQEGEIKKFQEEKIKVRKELKIVRRELKKDINSLGMTIKFFNILFIPIIISLIGIIFAVYKKSRYNK